jgi:hypothetical protein
MPLAIIVFPTALRQSTADVYVGLQTSDFRRQTSVFQATMGAQVYIQKISRRGR